MRLLLVHNILNDSTSISGVLREYVNMAHEWRALGHTVDFLVARAAFRACVCLDARSRGANV